MPLGTDSNLSESLIVAYNLKLGTIAGRKLQDKMGLSESSDTDL